MQKLIALFACPSFPTADARIAAELNVSEFVALVLLRTQLPCLVALGAFLLLERIKRRHPLSTSSSGDRLFISAFMVASKVISNHVLSNGTWAHAGHNMSD